jgi:hypothetical protein
MAFPVRVTLGMSVKSSADYQSEEVTLIVSWELERSDTDLQKLVAEKAEELKEAHATLCQRLKGQRQIGEKQVSEKLEAVGLRGRRKKRVEVEGEDDSERLAMEMEEVKGEEKVEETSHTVPTSPLPATSPPDPNQPLTEPQKRAVLLLAERVMGKEKIPEFLKEVTGKEDISALTWLEAATVIAQLQKALRAKRAKETVL